MVSSVGAVIAILVFNQLFPNNASAQRCDDGRAVSPPGEVDDFIASLKFDPKQILTTDDESAKKPKKEGKVLEDGRFVVISRTPIYKEYREISMDWEDNPKGYYLHTYPGSMLLIYNGTMDGREHILTVDRGTLSYTVDLPGLRGNNNGFRIRPKSYQEYQSALDKIVDFWLSNLSRDFVIPAQIAFNELPIHSREELSWKIATNFKSFKLFNIDFDALERNESSLQIFEFRQTFYSVSVEPSPRSSDFFGPCVTPRELVEQGISSQNPPVLVSRVNYGRLIYATLTTSLRTERSTLKVLCLEGCSDRMISELNRARDIESVKNVTISHDRFDSMNRAGPISYGANFLDNTWAIPRSKFYKSEKRIHDGRVVDLRLSGGYVVKISLRWEEISFDHQGGEVRTKKHWERNGQELKGSMNILRKFGGNVTDIHAIVSAYTIRQAWEKVFEDDSLHLNPYNTLVVKGTIEEPEVKSYSYMYNNSHGVVSCACLIFLCLLSVISERSFY